ncbi:hypothetical protein PLESTB_000476000 [Pleodorina starrii]|uniref:Uncharacterized protein n=1 Tax=Pleodorina starrii TaxID=330485 RepID=A0A9W6F008_9CHLO|nr:hypothetical protein PLESTM_001590800 [Pleodorina starrii]GLC51194.1 hypothetical protein PLESTB_000476000 [Pleodorina starrii]GLC63552.1 hypothetical protein PLESTF_000048500 [Pleodorina starrii]
MDVDGDGLDEGLLHDLFTCLEQDADGQNGDVVESSSMKLAQGIDALQREGQGLATTVAARKQLPARQQQKLSSDKASQGSFGSEGRSKRARDADKVKELEAIAAAKMEQFAALLQRNNELKFKSKILADAVMLRDIQLRIVKEAGRSSSPWPIPSLPGGGGTAGSGLTDPVLAELQLLRTAAQAVHAPGSVRLLLAPEVDASLEQTDVVIVGRQQVAASWKGFVAEASTLLLALDVNPADEAAACRMKQVTAEISRLCRHMSLLAPDTMLAVMQTHLETSTELTTPEPGFWSQVLQSLRLTEEQLRELRAVYELFSGIMRRILAERRAVQAQLSAGLQAEPRPPLVAQQQVPPEAEVLPSLERNMRKEGAAHLLVRAFMFGRVLSIVQMCRAAVHSYPYFPNPTGLAAAATGVSV